MLSTLDILGRQTKELLRQMEEQRIKEESKRAEAEARRKEMRQLNCEINNITTQTNFFLAGLSRDTQDEEEIAEHLTLKPETLMNNSVPPLVQQEVNYYWSDDEGDKEDFDVREGPPIPARYIEEEEEMEAISDEEFLRYFCPPQYIEPLEEEDMAIEYEQVVEATIPSHQVDDCRPVQALDVTLPPPPPREKASDYMGKEYTPRFRFGPGKSRIRWPDPFEFSKRLSNFISCFLMNNGERKELNGLDMGLIKYKPPD